MKVLITGASSGIGRDMAREFAERKYDLVLVARDEKRLNELKTELEVKYKINVKTVEKDLSEEENCISLYEENKNIDILVNNAGFGVFGEFDKTDLQKELNLIKTNIMAVHILTKLYLKDMIEKDSGKILNVSSIAGSMPGPLMCAYYASKAYVLRLSEGIREELNKKKSHVKISVLQPGPVNTNFNNVAGVKFNLSSKSSEYVAKYAVQNFLKGKFNIVPGFSIKCAISLWQKFAIICKKRKNNKKPKRNKCILFRFGYILYKFRKKQTITSIVIIFSTSNLLKSTIFVQINCNMISFVNFQINFSYFILKTKIY